MLCIVWFLIDFNELLKIVLLFYNVNEQKGFFGGGAVFYVETM